MRQRDGLNCGRRSQLLDGAVRLKSRIQYTTRLSEVQRSRVRDAQQPGLDKARRGFIKKTSLILNCI